MVLRHANLALRFLLEGCALVALAHSGFHLGRGPGLKWTLAVALPVAAALVWGLFVAPKARVPVGEPWRFVIEIAVFGSAIGALYLAGRTGYAIAFLAVLAINAVLLFAWDQR